MKKIYFSLSLLFICATVFSQAYDGSIKLQKKMQPAAVIQLAYPTDVITAALKDFLSKKGRSKGNDLKGFTTYRNTQQVGSDSANADLYFKIERKSRDEKGSSMVYLLLTTPDETSAASNALHYMNMEQAKSYLNELVPAIQAFDLELKIKEQNDLIIAAESKQKKLMGEGEDLEKKKTTIIQKIADNKLSQQAQDMEVQNQKQKLAALVNQRKA
jgi:hypothetical protein